MTSPSLTPLLKWAGGKRSEIPLIKPLYPTGVKRIIEPFAGGAAVSLDLNPGKVILNDVNLELIKFYQSLGSPLRRETMVEAIAAINALRLSIGAKAGSLSAQQVRSLVKDPARFFASPVGASLDLSSFPEELAQKIKDDLLSQLRSKALKRLPALEKTKGSAFSVSDKRLLIETALQAGVYTSLRRVINGQIVVSEGWKTAAWYLVRSLCYSGMFRYSKSGAFNVPYGGMSYNGRDFASSLAYLRSPEVERFFSSAELHNLDFEELLSHYRSSLGKGDFVFVDPPYDSAFSKYNATADFEAADQQRLAAVLRALPCSWMIVIKNTPLIASLYQGEGLSRAGFGKTYAANFRNRHARDVEHLVVTNYPLLLAEQGPVIAL